jgi:hypothetical protein
MSSKSATESKTKEAKRITLNLDELQPGKSYGILGGTVFGLDGGGDSVNTGYEMEVHVSSSTGQLSSIQLDVRGYQDINLKFTGTIETMTSQDGKQLFSCLEYNKKYDELSTSERTHADASVEGGVGALFWSAKASAHWSKDTTANEVHFKASGKEVMDKFEGVIKNMTKVKLNLEYDATVHVRPGLPSMIRFTFQNLQIRVGSKIANIQNNSASAGRITDDEGNARGKTKATRVVDKEDAGPLFT